ncbi:hypothetical protein ACNKHT_27145 [Shigella flexneri]
MRTRINQNVGATEKQLAIFNTFCGRRSTVERSIAASGGILLWPQSHFDWVRRASFFMASRRWKIAPPVPIWLSAR